MPLAALIMGCGTPATISPAQRAAQKRQQAREAAAEKRQEAAAKAAAAKAAQQSVQAAAQAKHAHDAEVLAQYNASQLSLDPLPVGVHQVGSEFFITDNAHASNLRHVCTGRDGRDSNDVSNVAFLPNGEIKVTCQAPVERFRSENWEAAYERRTGHR